MGEVKFFVYENLVKYKVIKCVYTNPAESDEIRFEHLVTTMYAKTLGKVGK